MKIIYLILSVILLLFVTVAFAQPDTLWTRTYGGTETEVGNSVQQTNDGGFIIVGGVGPINDYDLLLIKTDSDGDTLWTKTYGGPYSDEGFSVQQTYDGGYLITGSTASIGAGGLDLWLIKTDSDGDTLWTRTYGGPSSDEGFSAQQTFGGYIVTGYTMSFGVGNSDLWLLRTDSNGDTLWTKTFGGNSWDRGSSVVQTNDNGFAITGYTRSFGAGTDDLWLLRTDSSGDILWTRTYGGPGSDKGSWLLQTDDGGYVITGFTASFGVGSTDLWLLKTNSSGDTLWTRTYGGVLPEEGKSVHQTDDGGYVITGFTASIGAGNLDLWLIKTDSGGDTIWTKTYGGPSHDEGFSVQQTDDKGYIVTGYTRSFDTGGGDIWLLRFEPDPNRTWHVSTSGSDSTGDGSESNPFATIQTGIDASLSGDTVLVLPGIYQESINFLGKNITVGSLTLTTGDTSYISQTVIDGDSSGSVVTFNSREDSTAVLCGFLITGGYLQCTSLIDVGGAGIACVNSSPTLLKLHITGNILEENVILGGNGYGAGINLNSSDAKLSEIIISDNICIGSEYGQFYGGGVYCINSSPELLNVIIHNNQSDYGGGICCDNSSLELLNATICNNLSSLNGSVIYCLDNSYISITNSIIWGNAGNDIYSIDTSVIDIAYSDISGGYASLVADSVSNITWNAGIIDAFPVFCDPDNGNYKLADNSPCVGTGDNGTNMGALGLGCGYISTDNMALRFNDITDDYVAISYNDLPTGSNPPMTITAWVQCEEGQNFRGIIGWGETDTDASAVALGIGEANGLGGAGMRIWVSHWGGLYDWNTGVDLHPGWNHIAYVHDGSQDIVYLDGELVANQLVSFTIGSNPTANIGFWDDFHGTPYYFNGIIDEVRVWRIVRTQVEIQDYMYRGLTGSEGGLDGLWSFNEGEGDFVNDFGGGNPGIIHGAEWVLSGIPLFGGDSITLIIVPDDQPTIQDAIGFADFGDTVLVMPGTYVENINFLGKNITVGSLTLTTGDTSFISQTIINGNDSGRVVLFTNGEDSTALFTGFTITNGNSFYNTFEGGGGISCWESSPRLEHLIVKDNRSNYGGGINLGHSRSMLWNVVIDGNETYPLYGGSPGLGGGIANWDSNCRLSNVIVMNNHSTGEGGGISNDRLSTMILENVTIAGNTAVGLGSGIYCRDSSIVSILNSIIWNHSGDEIHLTDLSTTITISYSTISGGIGTIMDHGGTVNWLDGNINALPLFCNPDSGVYTLAINSPCVGTGENGANMGALGIGCGYISTDNLALRFNDVAHDHVALSSNGLPTGINPPMTITAWIQGETGEEFRAIIGWGETASYASSVALGIGGSNELSETGMRIWILHWGDSYNWNTGVDLNEGWNHIGYVFTGTQDKLYLNGYLVGSNTISLAIGIAPTANIGFWDDHIPGSPYYFNGIIDEVQVWDTIRTESEIRAGMYREPTWNEPGLVGYWNFNAGSGNTLFDQSISGNDGVINGAEWVLSDIPLFGQDSITLIIVPDDQPTIQAGIDFATHGDTVLVMPGTYVENINFNGKNIIVGSLTFTTGDTSYIGQTIIDGNQNGSVVTFENWEDSTARLCGFSLINGSGFPEFFYGRIGGAICCFSSSPTLSNLIISANGGFGGGGIFFGSSNSHIVNCRIKDNLAFSGYGVSVGGGISAVGSDLLLENLVFANNIASIGSAIYSQSSRFLIRSSTFVNTDSLDRSIIYCTDSSNVHLSNSILWNPGQTEIQLSEDGAQNTLMVTHCNIEGGLDSIVVGENTVNWLTGNIDADPLYIDPDNGIYQLLTCSPCIGTGSNDSVPAVDIDGNLRPDPPGSLPDMGAFEHPLGFPRDIPEIQVTQFILDFDEAFLTYHDTLIYRVSSWGCDVLYIFAETDLVEYVVEPEFIALEQGERDSFLVIFTPIYCSNYPGNLTLTTNDEDESTIVVPLTGQGVLPPNISVYPYRYDLEMNLDLMETHTSVISNSGGSDLVFELTMEELYQQSGYALQFDGIDDYIDCGDLGFGSGSDSITVAMWINPNTHAGDRGFWEFPGGTEQFSLSIQDGYYHTLIAGQYFDYPANPAGVWAHVAVTFDGFEQSFYLNGELQGSNQVTYPASFDLSYSPFWIGFGGLPAFAAGAIDAVMVWNTVRDQDQISSDMHHTVAYDEPGLVGYWRFNEGIGDTTSSYTLVNHTGAIYGAPQWIESTAPITSWITVQPLSGTIESGGSQDISIVLDASNLLVGEYNTEIQLFSNDPDQGLITIPVSLTTVVSVEEEPPLPVAYQLHQNYPNPFNPVTTIRYDLPIDSHVRLTIYNILGHQVIVLADDHQAAGYKSIRWNGRNTSGKLASAGMYFYAVEAGKYSAIRKMVLLK